MIYTHIIDTYNYPYDESDVSRGRSLSGDGTPGWPAFLHPGGPSTRPGPTGGGRPGLLRSGLWLCGGWTDPQNPTKSWFMFFFCKLCYSMLFPTCQARLVRFYCQLARLRLLLLRRTRRTWTATSGSKWPPPDLNCKLEIAVSACLPASQPACLRACVLTRLLACLLAFFSFFCF